MPVGGAGAGVTLRVVSRGSCARAGRAAAQSTATTPKTSIAPCAQRRIERAELVVCVSLTHERTVYFTL